jgi:DOMON domain.
MSDCDMIGALTDGSTVTLKDYYSYGDFTPSEDTQLGGQNNLIFISGGLDSNGYINVTFKRLLNTEDTYDSVIVPDEPRNINWAYLDHQAGWLQHSNESTF